MKQLSAKDRQKAMDVLAKCAAATKDITDVEELNKTAYGIFHEAFPNQPEMIKRACQAYNSAKSIHKLSTADDSSRGNDFSILNPNAMYDMAKNSGVTNSIKKAASALGLKPVRFQSDPAEGIAKAASAADKKSQQLTEIVPEPPMSNFRAKQIINENIEGFESCFVKLACACNRNARAFEDAKAQFIGKMASESPGSRKVAAEILHSYYGETGDAMINAFNEAHPLKKIASYNKNKYKGSVSLPHADIYKYASAFVSASEQLRKSEERGMLMLDLTLPCLKELATGKVMGKTAAAPATAVPMISAMLGVETSKAVPELVELDDPDETKTRKAIYTTELKNRLKEHSMRRAFMDILLDPSIQKYPIDKILNAYNISLKETPLSLREVPDTANIGLLKARTLALLGRGGVPSAGDADTIMNIQKVYGKVDPEELTSRVKGDN